MLEKLLCSSHASCPANEGYVYQYMKQSRPANACVRASRSLERPRIIRRQTNAESLFCAFAEWLAIPNSAGPSRTCY